jgi:hypothetical protein
MQGARLTIAASTILAWKIEAKRGSNNRDSVTTIIRMYIWMSPVSKILLI